ncbi:putative uncharacterized protein encoded by LINC00614 [Symphalangus syndactylus]|uniref:putative uncharacterized protein encoded by LINC00614 n=1 Tax=Symphalangus syndactylus TaxID=9590 RepID=UPI003006E376
MEGRNCMVEILPERLNIEGWYDADDTKPGKSRARRVASIERLSEFDNNLFGISDLEAECLDPQQKLLLECTYGALESAGVPAKEVAGSRTGDFIGERAMNRNQKPSNNNSQVSFAIANGFGVCGWFQL